MAIETLGLYPVSLDVYKKHKESTVYANENDFNGRGLLVTVTKNNAPFDCTGMTLKLGFRNAVGEERLYDFTAVNITLGTFKITYPTEMLVGNGGRVVKAEVKAYEGTGALLNYAPLFVYVNSSEITDDALAGTNEASYLSKLTDEVAYVQTQLGNITPSQIDFVSTAETNRVNAETTRGNSETSRVNAESSRVTAESGRVTAEESRVTAESDRVTAEDLRETAEATREANDIARGTYVEAIEANYAPELNLVKSQLADSVSQMQAQVDIAVNAVAGDAEVVLARGTELTLKNRLDASDTEIDDLQGLTNSLDYLVDFNEKKNIVDGTVWTAGFYTGGNLSYPSDYFYSEAIPVNVFAERYYRISDLVPAAQGVCVASFFKDDMTYVSQINYDQLVEGLVPIPKNADIKKVIFNCLTPLLKTVYVFRVNATKQDIDIVGAENYKQVKQFVYGGDINALEDTDFRYGKFVLSFNNAIDSYGYMNNDPVEVESGAYYKVSETPYAPEGMACVFFNNGTTKNMAQVINRIIQIPANATKIQMIFHCDVDFPCNDRITLFKCDVDGNMILNEPQRKYYAEESRRNRIFDKKCAVIGDSITWGQGATSNWGERWSKILADTFRPRTLPNYSYPGASVSSVVNAAKNMIAMCEVIPTDTELLIINVGVNDCGNNLPLGVASDTTDATFYGALEVFLNKITKRIPLAEIVYISPFHNGQTTLINYTNAIIEVAHKYGIKVINGFECGLTHGNAESITAQYSEDGLHPNTDGYKKIATALIREI